MISRALSSCFTLAVQGREWAYRSGAVSLIDLPARVVSVGNLTLGGAGKTPLVSYLAGKAIAAGETPWILTRGYGRRQSDAVIVAPNEPAPGAESMGDEPLLLKRANPRAGILVHADRGRVAQKEWQSIQAKFVILDDAFQHWRVCRDFDLVVVDLTGPIFPKILPEGRARELPQALRRADAIVFTRAGEVSGAESLRKISELAQFLDQQNSRPEREFPWKRNSRERNSKIPFYATSYRAAEIRHANGIIEEPKSLQNRQVIVASGIANPASFRSLLESLGARVMAEFKKPDHHWLAVKELDHLASLKSEHPDALLVITEKDAARWQGPLAASFDDFAFLTILPEFIAPSALTGRLSDGEELYSRIRGEP